MDQRIILSKIANLIYRSREIGVLDHDDVIRDKLQKVATEERHGYSTSSVNCLTVLKTFCLELLDEKTKLSLEAVKQRLSLILEQDQPLYKSIIESIETNQSEDDIKTTINTNIKLLNNYFKENDAQVLLSKASYDLKFNRSKISNFNDYVSELIASLEPLRTNVEGFKDPAIVNDLDFSSKESVTDVFRDVKASNNNSKIFRLGIQDLNTMFQGGIRLGECVTIGALQHEYKTGTNLSLFMQIARLNEPFDVKPGKKPLLLRISLEDSSSGNLQFMYTYVRAHEDPEFFAAVKENPDHVLEVLRNTSEEEMTELVVNNLTKTGFNIRMIRADPTQWGYINIINKILELEAAGYDIKVLVIDYVTLLQNTGCTIGVAGSEKKDLIRRIRNFCSARDISFITPIQLSAEAKQLLRNGVPHQHFVKEIRGKGYYDGCRTLEQDIDLEILIHKFTHHDVTYISFGRGKHRIPTVISDKDMTTILRFPGLNLPIMEDINGDNSAIKVLPKKQETENDKLLNELF